MTPDEMRDKALELLKGGFHCSQAVLAVGQEKMGLENTEVLKAVGLFGGGISGTGGICGALSDGIALISSLYSRGTLEDKESPRMWKLGHILSDRFDELTKEFGGPDCRDIARVDWTDRDAVKAHYEPPEGRGRFCFQVVGDTAKALGEILEKEVLEK